ncbi:hypothetical protein [Natrinema halophilum]|uniref:hypothetical protein n=1 Tax=Natrinema halophilum TaxID=1699371 RepID=UPI001F23386E|nr:hypothetical protein [Natrinema halophilum]UHQ96449.1 hypothetical protein HYG82_23705 [Natrinema halophilum]
MRRFSQPEDIDRGWLGLSATGFAILAVVFVGTAPETMSGGPMTGLETVAAALGMIIMAIAASQLTLEVTFDQLLVTLWLFGIGTIVLFVLIAVLGEETVANNPLTASVAGLVSALIVTVGTIAVIAAAKYARSTPRTVDPDDF